MNTEEDNQKDDCGNRLYYLPEEELINIPPYQVSVHNKYWNLRDVAGVLTDYNFEHGICIGNDEDNEDNEE